MVIGFQLIASSFLFLFNKKIGTYLYELFVATVYLITLSYIQTLDIPFPIYFIFSILPFINKRIRYKRNLLIPLLIILTTFMISIIINKIPAISIFMIRLSGILYASTFYSYLLNKNTNINLLNNEKKICIISVLCECIIFGLGLSLSSNQRLMLNYQCTVGCITTGSIILILYYCLLSEKKKLYYILLGLAVYIVLRSGTRGYILVTLVTIGATILLFTDGKTRIIGFLCVIASFFFVILTPADSKLVPLYSIIKNQLGIDKGTGRRGTENLFVLRLLSERPFFNALFGNGYGTIFGHLPETPSILNYYAYTDYTYNSIFNNAGIHNMWGTILYSNGIIGLFCVCYLYYQLFVLVRIHCNNKFRIILYVYLASYAVLLWFRWSATSGIFEFLVLFYVLSLTKNSNSEIILV